MTEIQRSEIEEILQGEVPGDTVALRNAYRRAAVEQYLSSRPNRSSTQGSEHDMILSDLDSYPGWEKETDAPDTENPSPIPPPRSFRPTR